jgi:hypothetical protein
MKMYGIPIPFDLQLLMGRVDQTTEEVAATIKKGLPAERPVWLSLSSMAPSCAYLVIL